MQQFINHHAYPIAQPHHEKYIALVNQIKRALATDGCALVKNFLSEYGLQSILQEVVARREHAYFSDETQTNAYFSSPDSNLPTDHPVNIPLRRTNGFITSDYFGEDSTAYQLYHWSPLSNFLAQCLGKEKLYIYADPISNMIVNVGSPGTQFNWHFDTNEFTITMLLRAAAHGGHFEYAPNISRLH